jgi:hypothetical protein
MTRNTNARIAGVTFLVYIAAGLTSMMLFVRATGGEGIAARIASIALHSTDVRLAVLLNPLMNLSALVLGVTLWAITRDQDRDLAMLGLTCRLAEGIAGMDVSGLLGLLWLATTTDASAIDAGAASTLGAYLLKMQGSFGASATFFALGSTVFSWLLLRGRMIPAALAWLGVFASVLLVVCLPLQLAGFVHGPLAWYIWLPMFLFEVSMALWLIVKGVAPVAPKQAA